MEIDLIAGVLSTLRNQDLVSALFESQAWIILIILLLVKLTPLNFSSVWYLYEEGRVILFIMGSHCCLNNPLKILAFSKKLATNLLSTRKGGIIGTFLPLTNVSSIIVQYVFAEVK